MTYKQNTCNEIKKTIFYKLKGNSNGNTSKIFSKLSNILNCSLSKKFYINNFPMSKSQRRKMFLSSIRIILIMYERTRGRIIVFLINA